jgi:hypothetical protein
MKRWKVLGSIALVSAIAGCGDDGGNTTTGTGGSTTSSTTSTTSSASTTSGTGGATPGCLDASAYAGLFTIADKGFCAVAVYEADESLNFGLPSWGSHDGPLTLRADATGGGVTLVRWKAPSGATGKLTKQETHVAAGVPDGAYLGGAANDLPFFGWTAISWTGPAPSTAGQIVAIANGAVGKTYDVNGIYALAGVSDGAQQGRLLYTGLSPLGATTTSDNGLFAADACSAPAPDLGAGQGCAPSALVSAWGEYSGPIAIDKSGNAFAVLTKASDGTQEARGFVSAKIARGAPPTAGVTIFSIPGFGSSLAAIAPTASAPGVLVFQPFDAKTYDALDVIAQRYTAGADVAAMGQPATLLTGASKTSGLSFMTDGEDRLWVAASTDTKTTYVVLAPTP